MPPTPKELDKLVDHLAFEYAALESTADQFLKTNYWVFLETFLLHSRLLRDFLWANPNPLYAKTEVLAEHYSSTWPQVRSKCPPTLTATRKAMNAQLAHISRRRVQPSAVQDLAARVSPIRDEIRSGWKAFLGHLGPDPRAATFRTALGQVCAKLGVTPPP